MDLSVATQSVGNYFINCRSHGAQCTATMSAPNMTPVLAQKGKAGWKDVQIVEDQVGISGGFLGKPYSAASVLIMTQEIHMRFVEVTKKSDWFIKAVGGPKAVKGELGGVKVLDELRKHMTPSPGAAVADSEAVADDVDPMDELDEVLETPCKKPKAKAKPKAKGNTMIQSSIVEVVMPKSPACTGVDNGNFTATLYMMPCGKHCSVERQARLFVRVDCISWLLAYAADEHFFQGVLRVDNAEEPKASNSTAVAGLNIEWDFTSDAWAAEFVSGDKCGTVRILAMKDVSEKLWEKMVEEEVPGAEGNFNEASIVTRKRVSKELLELWCGAIAERQGSAFEKFWGLRSTHKKQKTK